MSDQEIQKKGISFVIPRKECNGCEFIKKDDDKRYKCTHLKRISHSYFVMKLFLGDKYNNERNYTLTDKAEDIDTSSFKSCQLLKK